MKLKEQLRLLTIGDGFTLKLNGVIISKNYNAVNDVQKLVSHYDDEVIDVRLHHRTIEILTVKQKEIGD